MEGSILNNLGIDPFYIILALAVLNLIPLIVVFVGVLKMQQLSTCLQVLVAYPSNLYLVDVLR